MLSHPLVNNPANDDARCIELFDPVGLVGVTIGDESFRCTVNHRESIGVGCCAQGHSTSRNDSHLAAGRSPPELRLAFSSAAPFAIISLAALFPVTGALVQVGLALGALLAGEAVRRLAARSRVAAFAFSSQLEFKAYYRAHPPRPFLYYVFYPALFPCWLVACEARDEFLLFKGYTLVSFLLLLASLGLQYIRSFPPELSENSVPYFGGGSLFGGALSSPDSVHTFMIISSCARDVNI
jgi:hypothetical protein